MIAARFLPLISSLFLCTHALAFAPSGKEWLTIASPHFRVHHTPELEGYARALTESFERSLPEIEKRLNWKAPEAIDVVVMDPSDSANGLAMNYPNTHIELFASPFPSDSPLSYYVDWANELATHELTHIIANDTTLGFYKTLRSVFGSWVKPNGLQPTWITEGLAVFEETSLTSGGRGRSPMLEALLREAVREGVLNSSSYSSIDRLNDGVPWWPAGNTQYLLGYTIQALPSKKTPNLPGKLSYENAGIMIFSPNSALEGVNGEVWADVWSGATAQLRSRYAQPVGSALDCRLTNSGAHTGGQAVSSDGWIYFSEEDWDRGYHLSRVRADANCNDYSVERLERKRYSGPTQVAASPDGSVVAYSAFDTGFESLYSDIYLWREKGGRSRLTTDERARDPAFLDNSNLLFVRANADISESIVQREIGKDEEKILFTAKPLERVSGLTSRDGRILFSLHANNGHEKVMELSGGKASALLGTVGSGKEFERNPFIAADGSVYFAASYGKEPQEIYRIPLPSHKASRVIASRSGYLDRPTVLADGKTVVAQDYGLRGLDLVRAPLPSSPLPPGNPPREDLHEFLTGESPRTLAPSGITLPASVPYSATGTTGTSLWPQYWFPEIAAARDGLLVGASTSGNDALNYHRYFLAAQYDSRANFPWYRAYYHNRIYTTNFHFEAYQSNNYFSSTRTSNRNSLYSVDASFPLWDFTLAFGTAYREKRLFAGSSKNTFVFQTIDIDRSGSTPSAIAPNWGAAFNNFIALYPASRGETTFVDERPQLAVYCRGLLPSHSVSLHGSAGFSTNRFLASNYYQGGGASPLNDSSFIVRGYPSDTLFGQQIGTANLAYTLPLAQIHHGTGTAPFFLDTFGLRLMGDAGTANYLGTYSGGRFQGYEAARFGKNMIYGMGADFLVDGSVFYHIPISISAGLHKGTEKRFGGESMFFLGINMGINRGTLRARPQSAL
ncbi:MAG TPA: hypothetical protein VIH99_11055 [Bdellovibrionota bacterium]|jgi:hypothetical protein